MRTKSSRVWVHLNPKSLLKARTRQGWSRKQLAEAIGVSQGAIQTWEGGTSTPAEETQQKLVEVLRINADGAEAEAPAAGNVEVKSTKRHSNEQIANATATIVAALVEKGLLTNTADVDAYIVNVMERFRS